MSGSYATNIILAFISMSGLLLCIIPTTAALPIRDARDSDDFNFPDSTETVERIPTNSCYVMITNTYNQQDEGHHSNGGVRPTNITSRRCCDGYTGEECNIISDPYLAASPCSRTTCPNFPNANCAVISRCGEDIPVFVDEEGEILDCGGNSTVPNITSLSCGGLCDRDPCEGLTCSSHPSAICLTSGCSCTPIWLLETGVSVNCTTGEPLTPDQVPHSRKRRQIVTPDSASSLAVGSTCSS